MHIDVSYLKVQNLESKRLCKDYLNVMWEKLQCYIFISHELCTGTGLLLPSGQWFSNLALQPGTTTGCRQAHPGLPGGLTYCSLTFSGFVIFYLIFITFSFISPLFNMSTMNYCWKKQYTNYFFNRGTASVQASNWSSEKACTIVQ
jgi:hypothetical protein